MRKILWNVQNAALQYRLAIASVRNAGHHLWQTVPSQLLQGAVKNAVLDQRKLMLRDTVLTVDSDGKRGKMTGLR
jgi:hypothetical protein